LETSSELEASLRQIFVIVFVVNAFGGLLCQLPPYQNQVCPSFGCVQRNLGLAHHQTLLGFDSLHLQLPRHLQFVFGGFPCCQDLFEPLTSFHWHFQLQPSCPFPGCIRDTRASTSSKPSTNLLSSRKQCYS